MLVRNAMVTRPRVTAERNVGAIAVSCRVRLARNLVDAPFPDWADESARRRIVDQAASWLAQKAGLSGAHVVPVGELDEATRALLCERHLISHDLADRGAGSGLVVSDDERVSVMINEEDHFRIQVISPGMDLQRAWEVADAIDTRMDQHFHYAFSPKLGYLTACPSNVGTGLRASVMVHLLGLRLTNDLESVLRALERLHLAVRGVGGEGSQAAGHMFQISNQETLGSDESSLIGNLLDVVGDVVHQERNARLRLLRNTPEVLLDCVARALAVIQSARIMESEEALDYLSALRLGVEMQLLRRMTIDEVESLVLNIQPGHLQKRLGQVLEVPRRDIVRADFMREMLAKVALRA